MALKPNGEMMLVAEQIIEDLVSEITYQFRAAPDGTLRLHLWGNIPHGNRDLVFDEDGAFCGAGVGCACPPKPNWLKAPAEIQQQETSCE